MIIGLSGFAGSGKDTVADVLVRDFGFVKMAFADPLREMALAIDPIIDFDYSVGYIRYSQLLDLIGYTEAKTQYPEVRRFLQVLGTEAVRDILGQNTWVGLGMRRAEEFPRVVFADMRFKNEAAAVADSPEGVTVRITRPGVGAANDHASEHDLDSWSFHYGINNDGPLQEVAVKVAQLLDIADPII